MSDPTLLSPEYSGPELCRLQAHEIVDLLRAKKVSPAELLEASRQRTQAVEPHINAMPTVCWERAALAAQALDVEYESEPGWLGGLPLGIKDLNAVKGVRSTWGTKGLADFVPNESDPLVERLEAMGGLVVGKTNTPEFGAGGNTFNDVFGPTLNPWNTRLNAGGSSGGAAASLITGEVWLSHGSDHGGSLRTPAAFCGIVGLRPSPGLAGGSSADQAFMMEGVQGPMARSVTDCALFLDAMVCFDPRQPISFPPPPTPYLEAVRNPTAKPRIAFTMDLGGFAAVDREVADHLRQVLVQLEKSGARIEEDAPDTRSLEATYHTLRGMMWATGARLLPKSVSDHLKATIVENTKFGQALTMAEIAEAQINRSRMFANMLKLFERFDVLAMPTVGCMPHVQTEEWVREIGGQQFTGYMDWLRFAFLATVTGLPAVSVPVGPGPRGLPVGLQMIGKPRGEAALLQVARFVELAMGGPLGPIDPMVANT